MAGRWDHLLDRRPVPLVDYLVDELAAALARELSRWPLQLDELAGVGAEFAPLIAPDAPRPPPAAYGEALRLARWELLREHEAYDDYMRNQRYLEAGLLAEHRLALRFLSRWVLEQLLAVGEKTEGRVARSKLVEVIDRLERTLVA